MITLFPHPALFRSDAAVAADRRVLVGKRRRVGEFELQQAAREAGLALPEYRVAADEGTEATAGLLRLHREAEAGLQYVVLVADVVAEVAVGLLDAQRVERVQAAEC